jgi:hypothetical protein
MWKGTPVSRPALEAELEFGDPFNEKVKKQ